MQRRDVSKPMHCGPKCPVSCTFMYYLTYIEVLSSYFQLIQHIPARLNKCYVMMSYKKVNVTCEFGIYVTSLLYLDILYTRLIHWHTTCFYGVLHIMFQLIDGLLVACVRLHTHMLAEDYKFIPVYWNINLFAI